MCSRMGSCWGQRFSQSPQPRQAEACTGIWAYFRAATGAVLLATEL